MSKGKWTHSICYECWKKKEPGRAPVRLRGPQKDICCFCGAVNQSGIYVREDPAKTLCRQRQEVLA